MARVRGALVLVLLGLCAATARTTASEARPLRRRDAPVAGALDYRVRERRRHDGEPYLLHRFRIPLDRARVEVVDLGMRRDLDRVLRERNAALVVNGGYYGTDGRAEGLVFAGGRELSPLLPRLHGGVVVLARGRAEHHAADGFTLQGGAELAIQCSPRLVVGGQPAITRAGEQTASRTALCVREGGRGLDVIVANVEPSRGRAGPTLYTFSRQLVAEGCEEALNLDGGPSTGAAWRTARGTVRAMLPRRGIRHALVFRLGE